MNPQPLRVEQAAVRVGPLVDVGWKVCIVLSVFLFTIGMLIANSYLQVFGQEGIELAKPQYILVGALWTFLTGTGYSIWLVVTRTWKGTNAPKTVRDYAGRILGVTIITMVFGFISAILSLLLGIGMFLDQSSWLLFGYILAVGAATDYFVEHMRDELTSPYPAEMRSVIPARIILHSARRGYFLVVLFVLYAITVYPIVPAAVGGGRLHQADIYLKPDAPEAHGLVYAQDGSGSIGRWDVVLQSSDALVITRVETGKERITLLIPKDSIRLLHFPPSLPFEHEAKKQ